MAEQQTGANRWEGRPWLAHSVRAAVYVVPFVVSVVAAFAMSLAIPPAPNVPLAIVRVFAITAVATVAMRLVDSLTRRMLPLAALFDLTLVFPDQAPSRLKVALRGGSSHVDLEQRLEEYQAMGADEPAQAAERLLELVGALSKHDRLTRGHSERVRAYAQMIGKEMGLSGDELDKLRWAGLIHDIGKLKIDPAILNKPGKLTDEEFEIIKTHPDLGAELAAPLAGWLGESVLAVSQHHEKWDGTGYPLGLRGSQISLAARIVAVADVFDVMTSVRSYKAARPASEARAELARCAGSHFDPAVVRAFMSLSLGRLRLAMGPLSWFTQLSLFPQQLLASASSGASMTSSGMAGVGASGAAGAAGTATIGVAASAGAGAGAAALTVAAATTGAAFGAPMMSQQYESLSAANVPAVVAVTTTTPAAPGDPVIVSTTVSLGSASLGAGAGGVVVTPTTAQLGSAGGSAGASPVTAAGQPAAPTTAVQLGGSPVTNPPATNAPATTVAPAAAPAAGDGDVEAAAAPTTTAARTTAATTPRATTTTAPRTTTTTTPRTTTTTTPRTTTTTEVRATTTTVRSSSNSGSGSGSNRTTTTTTAAPAPVTAAPTTAAPTTAAPANGNGNGNGSGNGNGNGNGNAAIPVVNTLPAVVDAAVTPVLNALTPVTMTGSWLLGSSAPGDVVSQPVLPLVQRDPLNASVPNLDVDRDSAVGRTIRQGGSFATNTSPDKLQRFAFDTTGTITVSGRLGLDLFVASPEGADRRLRVKAALVKCNDDGTSCTVLREGDSSLTTDGNGFDLMSIDFGTQTYQLLAGERFEVWVRVRESSATDVLLAYDTVGAASALRIG